MARSTAAAPLQAWRVSQRAVGAAVVVCALGTFGLPAMIPAIGVTLHLSELAMGLLVAMVGAGRLVADLPAGGMADRWPEEVSIGVAGVALTLGSGLLIGAPTLSWALAGAGVIGAASAVVNTVGMTVYARRSAPGGRGRAMAAYSMMLLSGQTLGPGVAGLLTSLASWRLALVVVGALGGVVTAATGLIGRPAPRHQTTPAAEPAAAGGVSTAAHLAILSIPFVTFFALGGLAQAVVPMLGVGAGWSASTIGAVLLVGGIGRLVSAWVAGKVADRWGRRPALLPGPLLMAAGAGLLPVGLPLAWLTGVVLLSAGSQGISVGSAVAADLATNGGQGRALGRFRLSGDVGLLAGPVVSAWLLARYGPVAAVAPSVILLLGATVTAAVLVPETRPGRARYRPRHASP